MRLRPIAALVLLSTLGLAQEDPWPLEYWVDRLESDTSHVRAEAAKAIGRRGPAAREAIPALESALQRGHHEGVIDALAAIGDGARPALLALLKGEDAIRRAQALAALARMGPSALPQLVDALSDTDSKVRAVAARELAKLETDLTPVATTLIAALDDPDWMVRQGAVIAIKRIGPAASAAVPKLVALLREPGAIKREFPADALAQAGTPGLSALLEAYPTSDGSMRSEIERALDRIEGLNEDAVPLLRDAAAKGKGPWKSRAIALLGRCGAAGLAPLRELAKAPEPGTEFAVIAGLGALGPACAKDSVEALKPFLSSKDARIAAALARALGELGPAAGPSLLGMIAHWDEQVAEEAATALGKIRPVYVEALPRLRERLTSKKPEDHLIACRALREMGEAAGALVADLLPLLDAAETSRWAAMHALGGMGAAAREAVPALARLVESDPDPRACDEAVRALAGIGPAARPAVPILVRVLLNPKSNSGSAAQQVLIALGPEASEAIAPLAAALADPAKGAAVAEVLGKIGEKAVPALREALRGGDARAKANAARALGTAGPAAAPAAPELAALLGGPDPDAARTARFVLTSLGPAAAEGLRTLLDSPDAARRADALGLLAETGGAAKVGFPKLLALLEGETPSDRGGAAHALSTIGPSISEVVPQLGAKLARADQGNAFGFTLLLVEIGRYGAPGLIAGLKNPSARVRRDILSAIRRMTRPPRELEEAVEGLLQDPDPQVQKEAKTALDSMRAGPRVVAPPTAKDRAAELDRALARLGDSEVWKRKDGARAMYGLALNGLRDPRIGPAAVALLRETDAELLHYGAITCGTLGAECAAAVPALVGMLGHADGNLRIQAVNALAAIGEASATPVAEVARAGQGQARSGAFEVLSRLGERAAKAAAIIVSMCVREKDESVRGQASRALWDLRGAKKAAIPALVEALDDAEAGVRQRAIGMLGSVGPEAATALGRALGHADAEVRKAAVEALLRLGPQGRETLEEARRSGTPEAREAAGKALAASAPKVEETLDALRERLAKGDDDAKRTAIRELATRGEEGFVLLVGAIADPSVAVRREAAQAVCMRLSGEASRTADARGIGTAAAWLRESGVPTDDLASRLIAALGDADAEVRANAARALGHMGETARAATQPLLEAARGKDETLAGIALSALASIGAKEAVPELEKALEKPGQQDRLLAVMTLGRMGAAGAPGLAKALGQEDWLVRRFAAEALSEMGLEAEAAEPGLRKALQDEMPEIRELAEKALKRIEYERAQRK